MSELIDLMGKVLVLIREVQLNLVTKPHYQGYFFEFCY